MCPWFKGKLWPNKLSALTFRILKLVNTRRGSSVPVWTRSLWPFRGIYAAAVASRTDGFRLPIRSGRSAVLDIQRKDSIYLGAGTTCDRRLRQTSDGVGWRFESGGWTGIADTSLRGYFSARMAPWLAMLFGTIAPI